MSKSYKNTHSDDETTDEFYPTKSNKTLIRDNRRKKEKERNNSFKDNPIALF